MPLIDELPTQILSHYFSADFLATRAPGPHLKTIVDDFLAYHGLYDKRHVDFADSLEIFATLGFAWERVVTKAINTITAVGLPIVNLDSLSPASIARVYEHVFSQALNEAERERRPRELIKPGEGTYRGIHYNMDQVNVKLPGPEEWKCTWASARGGLEAHPDWLMQIAGYAYAEGFSTAIIRGMYVNGYYEKGQMGKPVVRAWRLKWAGHELEENWALIEGHKDVMVAEGRLTSVVKVEEESQS